MSFRRPWLPFALALGCACARTPEQLHSSSTPPSRPATSSVDAGGGEPLDERLEAKLAQRDRLHDWRSAIFATRPQNSPSVLGAKGIPKVFATSRIATIRAYVFVDEFRSAPLEHDPTRRIPSRRHWSCPFPASPNSGR